MSGRPSWLKLTLLDAGGDERTAPACWTGKPREAASVAGDEALERYAFEAACDHYAYALREAGSGDAHHLLRRRYVRALLHAGRPEVANALCLEQVGRETDGVRVAELALELGSVFVFTTTDVVLVQLLQRALELLPTEPSPHRARAQARLAAALQPASPPEGPIAMRATWLGPEEPGGYCIWTDRV